MCEENQRSRAPEMRAGNWKSFESVSEEGKPNVLIAAHLDKNGPTRFIGQRSTASANHNPLAMKCPVDAHHPRVDHIGHDVSAKVLIVSDLVDHRDQLRQCVRSIPRVSPHSRFHVNLLEQSACQSSSCGRSDT